MQNFGTSPLELLAADAMLRGLVFLDQFSYVATWSAATNNQLTATATKPVNIQIDGDSDFIMQMVNITAFSTNATTVNTSPNFLLTITRSGSGRNIMSQPTHVQNICGNYWNNSYPGAWPMPGLLAAKNTTVLTLQNISGVDQNRVDIALVGFKVFYKGVGTREEVFRLGGMSL